MKTGLIKSGSIRWMSWTLLARQLDSARLVRYAGGATAALGVCLFVT